MFSFVRYSEVTHRLKAVFNLRLVSVGK